MTYYRIGPILVTSTIRPAKMGRGIKLQFHCMNIGLAMSDLVANLQYKPSPWTQTRVEATKASSWTRRETARPRKEQMNEADRALIGVEDAHLRREYRSTPTSRKASPSGASCPSTETTRTRRLLPYHPDDETVEVHRRWCSRNLPYRAAAGKKINQRKRSLAKRTISWQQAKRLRNYLPSLCPVTAGLTLIKHCQISSAQYSYPCPFFVGRCGQNRGRCGPMWQLVTSSLFLVCSIDQQPTLRIGISADPGYFGIWQYSKHA